MTGVTLGLTSEAAVDAEVTVEFITFLCKQNLASPHSAFEIRIRHALLCSIYFNALTIYLPSLSSPILSLFPQAGLNNVYRFHGRL